MPTNSAAWITGQQARPFEIKSAPYSPPLDVEIVIKNHALAINPIDWILQDQGTGFIFTWLKYPFILGSDVAGEVVEIGSKVTRFKIGDRVVGYAAGTDEKRNNTAEGGFQIYTVLLDFMTSSIPDSMSYESASVLPLGVCTAAAGLFQKDQLALQLPSNNPKSANKTLLVWGGSTSVGSNVIQLAVAAGYEVFATASPKNFEYVKKLGATKVFDYNSKTVIDDLINAFKGKTAAGAYSVAAGAADPCLKILSKCNGHKFIARASFPTPSPPPKRFVALNMIYSFMSWTIVNWIKSKSYGINHKFIFASTLIHNGIGKAVYENFLPEALARGTYIAAPDPLVAGKGLESIQAALDLQKQGMSAKKVVVSL